MKCGKRIVSGFVVLLGVAYAVTPYLTMWRLYAALRDGDAAALAELVDWRSVRSGVKQDIAEGVIGMPERQLIVTNHLPPFGAGFATGIAGNIVDRELTPERVEATVHTLSTPDSHPAIAPSSSGIRAIAHAFFDSPRSFDLRLRPPGSDPEDPPLRVRLELQGVSWKVVRIWVPQEIVERMQSRT